MDSPALEPESAGIQPITAQGSAPVQVALSPRVALVHAGGCSVAAGSGWAESPGTQSDESGSVWNNWKAGTLEPGTKTRV